MSMTNEPELEKEWWNGTVSWGTWRSNTIGDPPYELDPVVHRLLEVLPNSGQVLDLGCGWGRLTNYLGTQFPRLAIHGVDHSERLLEIAENSNPVNVAFFLNNGRDLPYTSNRPYDAAYSITVLQHIPEEAKWGYINQVHECLKPGGAFVFTVALGDRDVFMNRQIPDIQAFVSDLTMLWDEVACEPHGLNDWTWIECRK